MKLANQRLPLERSPKGALIVYLMRLLDFFIVAFTTGITLLCTASWLMGNFIYLVYLIILCLIVLVSLLNFRRTFRQELLVNERVENDVEVPVITSEFRYRERPPNDISELTKKLVSKQSPAIDIQAIFAKEKDIIILHLDGKGSTFLRQFTGAFFDLEPLLNHPNQSFANGYQILLSYLTRDPLNWIQEKRRWRISAEHKFAASQWLKAEIERLEAEEEAEEQSSDPDSHESQAGEQLRTVIIRLPSTQNAPVPS